MILDVTGIELRPGNGEHPGIECCCDECDYLLACCQEEFPDEA